QQPVPVQWSSLRPLPEDGWYWLESFAADKLTTMGGGIKFNAQMAYQAPQSAGPQIWHAGGQLAGTTFSATPQNIVLAPPHSQATSPATRPAAEGILPMSGVGPVTPSLMQFPATLTDRLKGRVRVFDAGGSVLLPRFMPPMDGTYLNPNWQEVRSQ